jgi:signal transduction histidine kinase
VRNPLAGIKGAMQVLTARRQKGDPELAVMQDITARIDALSDLLDDLMLFARPRPLQCAPLHLRRVVDESVAVLNRDESLRGVDVTVEGPDTVLMADGELIRATVVNLLLNSAQAMAGQGRIAIRLSKTAVEASIEVRDSGPGIPADIRAQVFEPFFTTKARGGGLGLAIARRTAERHGGDVTLECPSEGGTVATLTLPLHSGTAGSSTRCEPGVA